MTDTPIRQQQAERLEVLAGTWITEEDKAALRAGAAALAREQEMVEALRELINADTDCMGNGSTVRIGLEQGGNQDIIDRVDALLAKAEIPHD